VSLVSGDAVVATRELAELPGELLFTLDPTELRSRLAGLRVRLLQPDGKTPVASGGVMLFADATLPGKVDSDGRVELLDKLPGRYELDISALGFGSRRMTVVLEPGKVLDLGEIVFVPGPKLCLRFELPDGRQTQVRFVVKLEHPGDPLATLGPYDNVMFGNGDKNPYELGCFDRGTYELRVVGLGDPQQRESSHLGARPMRVVVGEGAPAEYAVRIEPTTGLCLRPPRESSRVSYWLVSTADGLPCKSVRIEGRAPERIELVRGEYTIAPIDSDTKALGQPQRFSVGSSFFTLELQP
jgi:hypothetical protein